MFSTRPFKNTMIAIFSVIDVPPVFGRHITEDRESVVEINIEYNGPVGMDSLSEVLSIGSGSWVLTRLGIIIIGFASL